MDDALLDVAGLTVRIPLAEGMLHPVRDVGFSVARGETLGIVGESGCGKSLTALAIMGLLPPRAQRTLLRLHFDGQDLAALSKGATADLRGNRMAMIFQEPMTSLNPVYTIGNQLEECYLRHRGGPSRAARDRASFLLEKVGISAPASRLRQYPHQLSGGLRQRVMIAMALMCEPELIIADEPTTALDVTIQAQILQLLKRLQSELGMAIILITHDLGIVAQMADRVVVMYAGQVVESAPTDEIFARPCHPYTQGLLRCLPVPGQIRPGARLGTIPGIVPSLIGEHQGCAFASRCPHAFAPCRRGDVALAEAGSGHDYRCLLSAEESLTNFRERVP